MKLTRIVKNILSHYESDCPGTKASLARILMQGKLAGTGKVIILPVDQGFEHGPDRSFAPNPESYDPLYHYSIAVEAGLNAYAAPLGMLEMGAGSYAGSIPTILKMNSSNSLMSGDDDPDQGIYASVSDALRLGCSAIGFTMYPGSDYSMGMMEEISALSEEAKSVGLAVVIWSYPRGGELTKAGETAFDVCAYAAHMACLLGAHIIKVKLPSSHLEQKEAKNAHEKHNILNSTMAERVAHIKKVCFNGKRLVVFSGGASKDSNSVYDDARAIRDGGGNGSIIGRNTFQRSRVDALKMLNDLVEIYKARQ